MSHREAMEVDVVIVGAGPSGLAAACRLGQLAQAKGTELNVVVVEKGSEVGAHILSGAVMDPRAMHELFPNWQELGCPFKAPVSGDQVWFMTSPEKGIEVPHFFVPPSLHNDGNQVISLGNVCRWLGQQAEALGIQVFPGFAATEVLFNDDGSVKGIATGDMGISHNGEKKAGYAPGMELHAKYTIFAEGCRGHLGKQLLKHFGLEKNSGTQHYALGIKELWDIDPTKHKPGLVIHTMGWPLTEAGASGGGFLYHLENGQVTLGLITDLSYSNPHLSPFDEMQRWKTHPLIKAYLTGGKRISYGARAINKGGWQAIPKLVFPGGMLAGDDAGFMNFPRIKGSHTAMKTGMLAAEAVFAAVSNGDTGGKELNTYPEAFRNSWVAEELFAARNVGPAMHKFGTFLGSAYAFIDQKIFRGKLPFTLQDPIPDHATLKPAAECTKPNYPKPDGVISFDKLGSVFLSNTNHEEDQPCHLQLQDPSIPIAKNLPLYDEPAQRYCPAGVYEVVDNTDGSKRFQI
ncbi:MAG: 4Fe-4S dicluster domain-containing protein, partial [Pseudomonadota bacterium]